MLFEVDVEVALVGEGLVTELEVALVGSLAGVEPVVGF